MKQGKIPLMARLFGQRRIIVNEGYEITCIRYKNLIYIIRVVQIEEKGNE